MSDQLLRDIDTILATPADEVRLIEGELQQINKTIDRARAELNSPAHASRSGLDASRERYNEIIEEQIAARDVASARLDEAKAGAEPASTRLMRRVSLIQAFVDRYDVHDKPKEDIDFVQLTQSALLRISLRAQPREAQVDRILHLSAFMSKFVHTAKDRAENYVALKGFAPLRKLFHEILSTRHSENPTVIGQSVIVAEKVYKIHAYAMQLGLECDEAWLAEVGTSLIEPIHLACMISRVAKNPLIVWAAGPLKFMSHFGDCILQALTGASPDLQIAACNRLLQADGYRPTRRLLNVLEFLFRQYRMLPRVRVIDGSMVAGDASAAFSLGSINEELHKLSHAHIAELLLLQ
jgi:hypothetical protein